MSTIPDETPANARRNTRFIKPGYIVAIGAISLVFFLQAFSDSTQGFTSSRRLQRSSARVWALQDGNFGNGFELRELDG